MQKGMPPMERRMRRLILAALAVLMLLTAVLANAVSQKENQNLQLNEEQDSSADATAFSLYVENGLWGARTAGGRVLLEPTWYSLREMSDSVLIARKNDAASDGYGLINRNGEVLAPFIYDAFEEKSDLLWLGKWTENEEVRIHLYRSNGERWSDFSFTDCTPGTDEAHGDQHLTAGENLFGVTFSPDGMVWKYWKTLHPVRTKNLVMELNADELAALPPPETLLHLGDAAAEYLVYLFFTHELSEQSFSAEDPSTVKVWYFYQNCTLRSAAVRKLIELPTDGFPSYQLLLDVEYGRLQEHSAYETVHTTMQLLITRDAAGAYTYSAFSDAQIAAQGIRPTG